MRKPTPVEVRQYAEDLGYKDFDVKGFMNHYESNGWKVGRVPMVSWQAAVRNWHRTDNKPWKKQEQQPRLPYRVREDKINTLNRRKAQLMRMEQTTKVQQELEQIRVQLSQL